MKSLHYVIIKTERSYNNTENINGIDYVVNVNIDNVESINRKATVICSPKESGIYEGNEVIVHHNIMRESVHVSGSLDKGIFYIGNNYYWVPVSEVILQKINNKWETLLDFVFLKPFIQKNIDLGSGLIFAPHSRKGMVDLRATIAITNKSLKGVNVNDTIIFSINSEHEFIIDGELMYKCRIDDILAKV